MSTKFGPSQSVFGAPGAADAPPQTPQLTSNTAATGKQPGGAGAGAGGSSGSQQPSQKRTLLPSPIKAYTEPGRWACGMTVWLDGVSIKQLSRVEGRGIHRGAAPAPCRAHAFV